MRRLVMVPFLLVFFVSSASAQDLTPAERQGAVANARTLAACLEQQSAQMTRILQLIAQSERQRDTARDARAREDADHAIDSLIGRASTVQSEARACLSTPNLPSRGGVIEREAPADPVADRVAETGGTVRVVEENTRLGDHLHVERGEQVDGEGSIEGAAVTRAVRAIGGSLNRCYEQYLERGSLASHQVTLVFTLEGSGAARRVLVERSTVNDRTFDRCVETAARRLRASPGPRGGDATFSYALRFGRGS